MLNSRLIRRQDAELHLQAMAYLIRTFGPPAKPPVPSPLHKTKGLENLAWSELDTRTVYNWAEDIFATLKSFSLMENCPAKLVAAGDGLSEAQITANIRLDAFTSGRNPYLRPSDSKIFYDPRDCSEPGHFVATTSLQLAELRISGFARGASSSSVEKQLATLTAAAYNRHGLILSHLPNHISAYLTSDQDLRAVPHKVGINNLCFATCLVLRVRELTPEQIIATYGVRMTKPFRKKIRQACRQIDSHTEELAILQRPPKSHGGAKAHYRDRKSA